MACAVMPSVGDRTDRVVDSRGERGAQVAASCTCLDVLLVGILKFGGVDTIDAERSLVLWI